MQLSRGHKAATVIFAASAIFFALSKSYAADYPTPKEGAWVARDFQFHTGETLPELKIVYSTVGEPSGIPVLFMHGTIGSATNFLNPQFAGELFGPGQPLDASKFYIIMPDAIGTGRTTKPSDGLQSGFPHYNYNDLIQAQHRLLTEGLGIQHVYLVMGNSMGGMESWMWAETYPDFMNAIVPMASTPGPMSGRNWLTRRLMIETIKRDPDYKDGRYTAQPRSMKLAEAWLSLTTSGGTTAHAKSAPTSEAGDKLIAQRLSVPDRADANDLIYQYAASADYNPWPHLEKIKVPVLAINSADDERNPSELGVMEHAMRRLPNIRLFLIPIGPESRGHSTTQTAKLWKVELEKFLAEIPASQ